MRSGCDQPVPFPGITLHRESLLLIPTLDLPVSSRLARLCPSPLLPTHLPPGAGTTLGGRVLPAPGAWQPLPLKMSDREEDVEGHPGCRLTGRRGPSASQQDRSAHRTVRNG